MGVQVASGFVIMSGPQQVVSDVSIEKLKGFCALTNVDFQSVLVSPSENPRRLVLGIQLVTNADSTSVAMHNDTFTFIFGDLFGRLGQGGDEVMPLERVRATLGQDYRDEGCFDPMRYDGDCSIGIICARTGRVHVSGDNQGFRRIFHYQDDDIFVVGTRLPGILKLLEKDWRISALAARIYLASREPRWPLSIIDGIRTLPPLHQLTELNGELEISSYWVPVERTVPMQRHQLSQILNDSIRLAVVRKVRGASGVLALSGGYDSTSLARLVSQLHLPITAVSIGYAVKRKGSDPHHYDETKYAENIAGRLGIPFRGVVCGLDDVRSAMSLLPRFIDQPGQDPTSFFLLCRAIRQIGHEVLISGIGGDACFARKSDIPLRMMTLLNTLRLLSSGSDVATWVAELFGRRGPFALIASFFEGKPPESILELLERSTGSQYNSLYRQLLGDSIIDESNELTLYRARILTAAMHKSSCPHEWRFLFSIWGSPGEYHVDIMASYLGLRNCMPFLDRNMTNLLLGQGANQSLQSRDFESEIFDGLPIDLMLKGKSGFTLPYDRWYSDLMSEDIQEIAEDIRWEHIGLVLRNIPRIHHKRKGYENYNTLSLDLATARFMSRLIMLKRYIEANHLLF